MKWFANDSDADLDPKIVDIIQKFGNAGIGALWRTWCFVARNGTATEPNGAPKVGWSLDSRGKPYRLDQMALNAGVSIEEFEALMSFASEIEHIDPKQWRKKIVVFPAMSKRADEYTKKLLSKAHTLTDGPPPDDLLTLSGDPPSTVQDKRSPEITRHHKTPRRRARAADLPPSPLFSAFWLSLPVGMKVAKAAALEAWHQLGIDDRIDRDELVNDVILPAVRKQTEAYGWGQVDGEYNPHPATWLRAERWNDEIDPARVARRQRTRATTTSKAGGGGATGAPAAAKSDRYAQLGQKAN
jgi:hypothetical protein